MSKIVHAVGALVSKEAAAFLAAEARECNLLDADDETRLSEGLAAFELVIGGAGTSGFARRAVKALAPLSEETRRKLLAELHKANRRLIYEALDGRVRMETGLDTLGSVLERYGFDLDALLDEGSPGASHEARRDAELRTTIRKALATHFADSSAAERFAAEGAIASAIGAYLAAHPRFTIAGRPLSVTEQLAEAMQRNARLRNNLSRPARPRFTDGSVPDNHRFEAITEAQAAAYSKADRPSRRRKGKKS